MIKKRISDILNGEVKISKFSDIQNEENKVYKIILDDKNNKVINLYVLQNVRIIISGHTCFSVLKNNHIITPFIFLFLIEIFPIKSTGSFFTTSNATFIFLIIAVIIALARKENLN